MSLRNGRPRGEEGSFTFAVLGWLLIVFMLMGLVINASLAISEKEQAANAADAVARFMANDIQTSSLDTGAVVISPTVCSSDYLHSDPVKTILNAMLPAGWQNSTVYPLSPGLPACSVANNTVTVMVTITYNPLLWSGNLRTSATATAAAVTGNAN